MRNWYYAAKPWTLLNTFALCNDLTVSRNIPFTIVMDMRYIRSNSNKLRQVHASLKKQIHNEKSRNYFFIKWNMIYKLNSGLSLSTRISSRIWYSDWVLFVVMDDLWVRSTRGYHKLEHNKHRSGERWSQVGAILLFTITIRLETLRLDGLRLQFSLRLEWRATRVY